MPRAKFKPNSEVPYLVTGRSRNQDWYSLPMPLMWEIYSDYLFLIAGLYNLEIHAFVLMSNHFHMILRTPNANLDKAMNYFMREVSKEVCRLSGRKNQIFGGPYHRTLLNGTIYYCNAYRYIYQNPVRAGICRHVEEYPYSTLAGLLGITKSIIPVKGDSLLMETTFQTLNWLNEEMNREAKAAIKNGLRKSEFKISQNRSNGKTVELKAPSFD